MNTDDENGMVAETGGTAPAEATAGERSIVREIFEWFEIFTLALACVVILFTFVFRLVKVDGESMERTLRDKDSLIISHMLYKPATGDIVVLQVPELGNRPPFIKRVIAVGGQTVDINFDTWEVRVDGELIDSSYVNFEYGVPMDVGSYDMQYPLTVEEGKVFVMGDNRNHSWDSRYSDIGQIDENNIVGRVLIRVAPINKLGVVKPNAD